LELDVSKRTRNRSRRNVEKERTKREREERQLKDARLKGFKPATTGDMLAAVAKRRR
jgi:hypothetical protein